MLGEHAHPFPGRAQAERRLHLARLDEREALLGPRLEQLAVEGVQPRRRAPVGQDLVAGQVAAGIGSVGAMSPYVKTGQVRRVAVNLPARMPAMPEVPTYTEQGMAGYESGNFVALFAPLGTSAEALRQLSAATATVACSAGFAQKLGATGITPAFATADVLAGLVREANGAYAAMVKAAGYVMP